MSVPEYDLLVTADDVIAHLARRDLLHHVLGGDADAADPIEPERAGTIAPSAGAGGGADAGSPTGDGRAAIRVVEVTAGNMNRVFLARGPAGSLAVKQAPPWVQVAGPDWPIDPTRIASEARTYELLAERVPESIPHIVDFDESRFVLVMEDLSDLAVLRDALVRRISTPGDALEIDFTDLGSVVGRFVGELAVATSALALGDEEHARLIELAANPELCALTIDVVLDEPYREHEHNHWHPSLEQRVRALHADADGAVRAAVARIREVFETRHEALVHGDLHSGSVMIGRRDGVQHVKVFDPEFSFVGPIGLDLGLFWANLELAALAASVVGDEELATRRYSAVTASLEAFASVWLAAGHDEESLARIVRDAWGFAGVEGIRRAAGYSHAADIESLPSALLPEASARLFDAALHHLLTGEPAPSAPGTPTEPTGP
ncbi:phosphotransferase [Herbiconiux liukaitaii]|uniref:phosphotransferase n=1 Tax=Herbiconiux liukaitaii TaxID=3342799 RepID=UPI0035B74D96